MSLFEIDLNYDFKILGCSVFLSENDFYRFYDLNKLYFSFMPNREEMKKNITNNDCINGSSILLKQFYNENEEKSYNRRYENDDILDFIKKDLYKNDMSYHKVSSVILYPEWLLFYIAINKFEALQGFKNNFNKHIELFKYIAQIRYKKYMKFHINSYVNSFENLDDFKNKLHNEFLNFLQGSQRDKDELFDFLFFLNIFRRTSKDIEKYKLMWNIETYIREVITLLVNKNIPTDEIYKNIGGGDYSELHEVYVLKDLYIEESKKHFQQIFLPKIKKLFPEATFETVMNYLTYNKKYENIILSYLEVIKYLNANKPNELVMGAMIRNMVLEVEEIIKGKNDLVGFLKSIALNKEDFQNKKVNRGDCKTGQKYLEKALHFIKEEETFDKYLLIYHTVRNYLAHHNINMDEFFWSNDKIIASSTINSVIIILYRIEMNKA